MESLHARSASFLDVDAALRSVEIASWLYRPDDTVEPDLETEEGIDGVYPNPYDLPTARLDTSMLSVGEWLQAPGRSEGEAAFKGRMRELLEG